MKKRMNAEKEPARHKTREHILVGVLVAILGAMVFFFFFIYGEVQLLPQGYGGPRSERIALGEPQDLPTTHPVYQEALAELKLHQHIYSSDNQEFKTFHGDLDGDGINDTIKDDPWPTLVLSRSGKTYDPSTSCLIAIGMDDLDGDGIADAWYCDPGDRYLQVIWGGEEQLAGSQYFGAPAEEEADGAAFVDIDQDGDLDLIYGNNTRYNYRNEPIRLYWYKSEPIQEK